VECQQLPDQPTSHYPSPSQVSLLAIIECGERGQVPLPTRVHHDGLISVFDFLMFRVGVL